MSLSPQVVPIRMAQGVDTKSDQKVVQAGKFLRLENARFQQTGSLMKRDGGAFMSRTIAGGGFLSSPQMMRTFKNELVCSDSGHLYSYSPALDAWCDTGPYVSCGVTKREISAGASAQLLQSACIVGSYALYSWAQPAGAISIQDIKTGANIKAGIPAFNGSPSGVYGASKVLAIAGSAPAAVSINSSGDLEVLIFSIATGGVSFNAFTLYSAATNALSKVSFNGQNAIVFDVAQTATGGVAVFGTASASGDIRAVTFDINGNTTHTFSLTLGAQIKGVSVTVDPTNGNIWVYYVDASSNVKGFVLSPTLGTVHGDTTLVGSSGNPIFQICSTALSTTQQRLFYSTTNAASSDSTNILYGTVTASGVFTSQGTLATNLDILSKPFKYGSNTYIGVVYRSKVWNGSSLVSGVQSCCFTLSVDGAIPGAVVAKYLYGSTFDTALPCGYVQTPISISSGRFGLLLPEEIQLDTVLGVSSQLTQSSLVTIDFGSSDAYSAIEAGDNLLLNGGIIWAYDGASTSELGFHLFPEVVNASPSSTGGSLGTGTYQWAIIFQWTDSQGNLHESAYSIFSASFGSGSTNSITLTIKVPSTTIKSTPSTPRIAIYRTAANAQTFHLVDVSHSYTPGAASFTFTDTNSDASIASDGQVYTNGGVLEDIAPPAALALCSHKNRIWLIPSESPNKVQYSKLIQSGNGVAFNDALTVDIDTVGGECVSLASLDDKIVVFEERLPFVMAGDGFDDTGANSTLTDPQPIPSDVGALGQKSTFVYPQGILRKTNKGIFRLDRGLSDSYFGLDVEGYNSQAVTDITLLPKTTEIRFLTSSGLLLAYDYITGQWATDTNSQGYSACIWNDLYVYARTDGQISKQTPGVYLDGSTAFSVLVQTSWLAFAGIQGFQRIWRFISLGQFINGASASHGVQVSAAYDFGSTFSTPISYLFGSASASGSFQYRERLPIQKCDAISLLIQEVTTGDGAEFVSLTDMSFEAGIKRGLNKLGRTRSVG